MTLSQSRLIGIHASVDPGSNKGPPQAPRLQVSTPWGHDGCQAEETVDSSYPPSDTAGYAPAVGSPPQEIHVTRDPTPSPPPPPPEVDTPTISRHVPNVEYTDF